MKPFVTAVSDYHEFEQVIKHFQNAGFNLDYVEVGCGHSSVWRNKNGRNKNGGYHAVFFEKGTEEPKELIEKWENHFQIQQSFPLCCNLK
jgi:hypothetical protein